MNHANRCKPRVRPVYRRVEEDGRPAMLTHWEVRHGLNCMGSYATEDEALAALRRFGNGGRREPPKGKL